MLVGYARTSTIEQTAGFGAQQRDLTAAGCEKVFAEQVSSVDKDNRVKLTAALDFVREGDTLVVCKLDRLARSLPHLLQIVDALDRKAASLRVLDIGLDTSNPTGRLMLNLLGSIAQFEREIMLERQREGIAKARAANKYKGRPPSIDAEQVKTMKAEGKGATAISREMGIGIASVYRILNG